MKSSDRVDTPLSEQVQDLAKFSFDPDCKIGQWMAVAETDPALCSKVIEVALAAKRNSSLLNGTVQGALDAMGDRVFKEAVLAAAFIDSFRSDPSSRSEALLVHSLATAVILREMAVELLKENMDATPFATGLLHHFGDWLKDCLQEGSKIKIAGLSNGKGRQLLQDAGALADILGCSVECGREADPTPEKLSVLSKIGQDQSMQICKTVQTELALYGAVFGINVPEGGQIYRFLLRADRELAQCNVQYEKVQQSLQIRISGLEMIAKVITGIMKSLEGDPLTFSVLESLMEGLQLEGAFMLNRLDGDVFGGYGARTNQSGEPQIDQIRLDQRQLSPPMRLCVEEGRPVQVPMPETDPILSSCLGKAALVWLIPARAGRRLAALIGLGIGHNRVQYFNNEFAGILEILSAEIGLSLENTRLYNQFRKEAGTDPLTGISNRRNITQTLTSEFARFKRKGFPLAVAIFDMDNFKTINDRLGHLAGDEFLTETARIIRNAVRESDYVGRYGGDEFIAVFPHTSIDDAFKVVERIRMRLSDCCEELKKNRGVDSISFSAGVAAAHFSMSRFDDLIIAADNALYKAKELGRNRCEVYDLAEGGALETVSVEVQPIRT